MHNARTILIIFTLADPHSGEGSQRRQDTASNPDTILPLRWTDNFDLNVSTLDIEYVFTQPLSQTLEHSRST